MTDSNTSPRKTQDTIRDKRPPFVMIEHAVLTQHKLRPAELAVYCAIVMHADATTHRAWPSQERLAEIASVSRKTVNAVVKRLIELGLIDAKPRGTGMKRALEYTILPATMSPTVTSDVTQSDSRWEPELHKQESLNQNQEQENTLPDAIAPVEPPKSKPKPKRKNEPPKPRREYDERDDLYETVEHDVFGIIGNDTDPYAYTAPTGAITKWLRGQVRTWRKSQLTAAPSDVTPDDITAFVKWWRRTNRTAPTPPQDPEKFARHFRAWHDQVRRTARYLPPTDPKTPADLDILLQEVG